MRRRIEKSTENIGILRASKRLHHGAIEHYEKLQHHSAHSGRNFGKVEDPGTLDHQDAFDGDSSETCFKRTT